MSDRPTRDEIGQALRRDIEWRGRDDGNRSNANAAARDRALLIRELQWCWARLGFDVIGEPLPEVDGPAPEPMPVLFDCGCSHLKVGAGMCDVYDERGQLRNTGT